MPENQASLMIILGVVDVINILGQFSISVCMSVCPSV